MLALYSALFNIVILPSSAATTSLFIIVFSLILSRVVSKLLLFCLNTLVSLVLLVSPNALLSTFWPDLFILFGSGLGIWLLSPINIILTPLALAVLISLFKLPSSNIDASSTIKV